MQTAQMIGIGLILLLMLWLVALQRNNELSEADIRTMVDAMLDNPDLQEAFAWSDAEIRALVNAQASHPAFLEAYKWSDAELEALVDAEANHPAYQTTAEEECAQVILGFVAVAGDYDALPPDSEMKRLCDWYSDQVE